VREREAQADHQGTRAALMYRSKSHKSSRKVNGECSNMGQIRERSDDDDDDDDGASDGHEEEWSVEIGENCVPIIQVV
jgi:hypothetical protein